MTAEKVINEVLIRYDNDGKVRGMHAVFSFVVKDNEGKILSSTLGSPDPVTLGIQNGLDLDEVLGQMNALNLVEIEALQAQNKQLSKSLKTANESLELVQKELSDANEEIENLKSKLQESNMSLVESNKKIDELVKQIPVKDEVSEPI